MERHKLPGALRADPTTQRHSGLPELVIAAPVSFVHLRLIPPSHRDPELLTLLAKLLAFKAAGDRDQLSARANTLFDFGGAPKYFREIGAAAEAGNEAFSIDSHLAP